MLLLPGWLLKEHADILAGQVSDILNYSYHEGRLPSSWKHAYVFPMPKQKPVREVNKHLRPISPTPIFSKMSEAYVVDTYVNLLCWRGLILNSLEPYLNLLIRMRLSVCNTPGWNRLIEMVLLREPYCLTFAKPLT